MLGAIIGDIVGSRYEFSPHKSKHFELFGTDRSPCSYTDDSVMTVAVAAAFLETDGVPEGAEGEAAFEALLVRRMHEIGRKHMDSGFGGRFYGWIGQGLTEPYGSYGNGSAMRVSPAGWVARSREEAERLARLTAEVTHNHPEGLKGAESVAAAIWMARAGATREEIRGYVTGKYYPALVGMTCDAIRPGYEFDESCQRTVPQAFAAFFEARDFEDAIRTAVSLGGDCDTLTCICGAMAEAFFGLPEGFAEKALGFLDAEMREITERFRARFQS